MPNLAHPNVGWSWRVAKHASDSKIAQQADWDDMIADRARTWEGSVACFDPGVKSVKQPEPMATAQLRHNLARDERQFQRGHRFRLGETGAISSATARSRNKTGAISSAVWDGQELPGISGTVAKKSVQALETARLRRMVIDQFQFIEQVATFATDAGGLMIDCEFDQVGRAVRKRFRFADGSEIVVDSHGVR